MQRYCTARHDVSVLSVTSLQARRASDLTPGRAKTDRIDAEVPTPAGRKMMTSASALLVHLTCGANQR